MGSHSVGELLGANIAAGGILKMNFTLISLILCLIIQLSFGERLVIKGTNKGGDCGVGGRGGKRVCNGAVIKELKTTTPSLQVCEKGKLVAKNMKKVPQNAPRPDRGEDCIWYGEVFCDGDIVQDLYRWWFLTKCGNGKMYVYARSNQEVRADPR